MKFSIIYEAQMVDTSPASEQRCFLECVEQSVHAEKMGFDTVWAVEHTALTYLSDEKITAGDEHTSNYSVAQDAYGNPDDCIRYCTRLQEAGADEILFMFQMGGIPHEAIMETIRNIGQKVIPYFREQELRKSA